MHDIVQVLHCTLTNNTHQDLQYYNWKNAKTRESLNDSYTTVPSTLTLLNTYPDYMVVNAFYIKTV